MKRWQKITGGVAVAVLLLVGGVAVYYLNRPIGSPNVPPGSVAAGWQDNGPSLLSVAGGLAKVRSHAYKATELGSVTLVAITPLPLVDLKGRVDAKAREVLAENHATSSPAGSGVLTVAGVQAPYDEFTVRATDGSWVGKLLRVTYHCRATGDFVAGIAFGVTALTPGGLVPGSQTRRTYDEARSMVQAMACS